MKKILLKTAYGYKNFFDKTIENSTITVGLICFVLFGVGFSINNSGNNTFLQVLKADILEVNKIKNNFEIITINGKKYKLIPLKK